MTNQKNAIIVGSGIAGLATSIRLKALGFEVTIYETNNYPGGKLNDFNAEGFRFDAGPSLFIMPTLVDELFEVSGLNPLNYFRYKDIETTCHYFYNDGTQIRAYADKQRLKDEIDNKLGGYGDNVLQYLNDSARTFDLTSIILLEKSLHKAKNYISKDTLRALANFNSLKLTNTVHQVNKNKLGHEKLVQLFNRYATYNGSSPYLAPGVLTLMSHLELNLGTFIPDGGMHEITTSLVKLAESRGVKIEYNSRIERININANNVKGVTIGGNDVSADLVVSNMDIVPTYKSLLPEIKPPRQVSKQEQSSSAIVYYWGIDHEFPELDLHNIFFSKDYKEEFKYIFALHDIYEDPTVYVYISSKACPKDAPAGKENWYVMINVPCDNGQDWDLLIDRIRVKIIAKLSNILNCDLGKHIVYESLLDPRSIELKTSAYKGSIYGASSNHWLSIFLRHPNFHKKIKGLYFCGGSVHPGGGIPFSILSAKIVAEIIKNDFKIQ